MAFRNFLPQSGSSHTNEPSSLSLLSDSEEAKSPLDRFKVSVKSEASDDAVSKKSHYLLSFPTILCFYDH